MPDIYQQYETGSYANPLLSRTSNWSLNILNAWPQSAGVRPVSVARAGQRGQRTTAGYGNRNRRTREDKRSIKLTTEPGHRVQGRGQSAWPGLVSAAGGQQQDNREDKRSIRRATEPGQGARLVSVARAGERGQRTTAGQQQDKRRTRPGSGQLLFF